MEHRSDWEDILLNGLPADERQQTLDAIAQKTAGDRAHTRKQIAQEDAEAARRRADPSQPSGPDPYLVDAIQQSLARLVRASNQLAALLDAVPPGAPFPAMQPGGELDRAIDEQQKAMSAVQALSEEAARRGFSL